MSFTTALQCQRSKKWAILIKHGIHVVVSFVYFYVIANQSPRTIKQWAPILYGDRSYRYY